MPTATGLLRRQSIELARELESITVAGDPDRLEHRLTVASVSLTQAGADPR